MSDIYVYQLKLPNGVDEMVAPDTEGGYTVYIDSRLPDSKKIKAYLHAVKHCDGDFEKCNVNEIEKDAHCQ